MGPTRNALELTPFCVIPGGPAPVKGTLTHSCDVPERSGYHIIYGAWDVADTGATFYNMIDAEFESGQGGIPSPWNNEIGNITPTINLLPGSIVKTRVFDKKGERQDLSIEISISSAEQGEKNNWSHALASKINQQKSHLRAGQKNAAGEIIASYGNNTLFTRADSSLTRVEIQITPAEEENTDSFSIRGLQEQYQLTDNKTTISFDVNVKGKLALEGKIFDAANNPKGQFSETLGNSTKAIKIDLQDVNAGQYTLVITGTNDDGKTVQENANFTLNAENAGGDYEFTYPDGIGRYQAGTIVLQPKTKKTYECKPFPFSGWCNIDSHHYVPGVGSNWQDAWVEK